MIIQRSELIRRAMELDKAIVRYTEAFRGKFANEYRAIEEMSLWSQRYEKICWESLIPNQMRTLDDQILVTAGNGLLSSIDAICLQLISNPMRLMVLPAKGDVWTIQFLQYLRDVEKFTEVRPMPGLNHEEKKSLVKHSEADLLVVYGSDVTIKTFRGLAPGHTKVVTYGSKNSIAYHDDVNTLWDYRLQYAEDMYVYDGTGCLNTSALYVKTSSPEPLYALASELSKLQDKYFESSPGALQAKMISRLMGEDVRFRNHRGVIIRGPAEEPILSPGGGVTMLVQVESFDEVVEEWSYHRHELSSITLEDAADANWATKAFNLGATRIARIGQAQSPGPQWKHDGMQMLAQFWDEVSVDF